MSKILIHEWCSELKFVEIDGKTLCITRRYILCVENILNNDQKQRYVIVPWRETDDFWKMYCNSKMLSREKLCMRNLIKIPSILTMIFAFSLSTINFPITKHVLSKISFDWTSDNFFQVSSMPTRMEKVEEILPI